VSGSASPGLPVWEESPTPRPSLPAAPLQPTETFLLSFQTGSAAASSYTGALLVDRCFEQEVSLSLLLQLRPDQLGWQLALHFPVLQASSLPCKLKGQPCQLINIFS